MSDGKLLHEYNLVKSLISFPELFQRVFPNHYRPRGNSICPWHNDNNPSFELRSDKGYCWSCKKWFDHADAIQLSRRVSRSEAMRLVIDMAGGGATSPPKGNTGSGANKRTVAEARQENIAAEYTYTDKGGKPLYQVVRYEEPGYTKTFRQRRSEGGKWAWNLKGVPLVLYKLPKVIAADTVWVCEGEKDVHALESLGLTATCNPMGAGKWKAQREKHGIHTPLFKKNVYIVPDNDPAGRSHADDIARSLVSHVRSCKVINLPDLPEKGDINDFIEQKGPDQAKHFLLRLAERTPEFEMPLLLGAGEGGEGREKSTPSQSRFEQLYSLVKGSGTDFFYDQIRAPWACVRLKDHWENVRVRGGRFALVLAGLFYEATGLGCGRETISQVQDKCCYDALFQGEQRHLSYRVAWSGADILIDLGTEDWSAVRVTPDGWTVVKPDEPPFRRFSHMAALPLPKDGGSIQDIFQVIPIDDEMSRVLLSVWLPSMLIPDIPRASLVFSGLQGSGKTFTAERLRELIDPSRILTLGLPRSDQELIQALDHHYLPVFDNLGSVPRWASDCLCRATTGSGFTKRELFTNDEDYTYFFYRSYILNGISLCASESDLLDRCLLLELARIEEDRRKSRRTLLKEFDGLRPTIFGAMLTALSQAMRVKESINLPTLPRLADWCEWAVPIAEAVGIGCEEFLGALATNTQRQHSEINQGDPTAQALLALMEDRESWTGSWSDLYSQLEPVAEAMNLTKEKSWPGAANALSRKVRRLSHNLGAGGLSVDEDRDSCSRKKIVFLRRVYKRPETSFGSLDRSKAHDNDNIPPSDSRMVLNDQQISSGASSAVTPQNHETLNDRTVRTMFPGICTAGGGIEKNGCRDGCIYFQRTSEFARCNMTKPPLDLTQPTFRCPRVTIANMGNDSATS